MRNYDEYLETSTTNLVEGTVRVDYVYSVVYRNILTVHVYFRLNVTQNYGLIFFSILHVVHS